MLTRFDPWRRICRQMFYARCYHRPQLPKEPSKNRFKVKRRSEEIAYFFKEKAKKLKDLHQVMERLERRQKKLHAEMDEGDKLLQGLLEKDKKAECEVNEDTSTKKMK